MRRIFNVPGFLFDTNVWVGLTFEAHPLHAAATKAFRNATAERRVYFCRSTQQSYLRLVSSQNIANQYGVAPISNRDAFGLLETFLQQPNVGYMDEPNDLLPSWKAYADLTTSSPKRWMDAYLAAFAARAGLDLVSADAAFKAFAGLALVALP
jgi:toxin-antitoxin system PIN domain toxin